MSELGKKLAERWLTLLVLPGALWVVFAAAAVMLGHRRPFDVGALITHAAEWTRTTNERVVILLVALSATAAIAGLAAQALGSAAERVTLAANWRMWRLPWCWLANALVLRREAMWTKAHVEYYRLSELAYRALVDGGRMNPGQRLRAYQRRARIAPERPDRPTWCGDRLNAAAVRVDRDLRVDLATVWPSLWLLLSQEVRDELAARRQGLTRGATLIGWAIVYVPLAAWWWPAILISAGCVVAGRYRMRAASDTYGELVEAVVRTYVGDLTTKLGVPNGDALTALLHTEPPAPDPSAQPRRSTPGVAEPDA
ncbi:hypothetical protein [Amycolatopsis sp. RTGN1]|uniref:hypothetical protein n=1 Tax=Amycolatopsis ponsaeliensis TaxID=2992142 RepID=UPI00254AB61C|nr:hypothetical protein [Amycolatopsis sp. RTGN1]